VTRINMAQLITGAGLALCVAAWWFYPAALLAAYLAAWWFWTGIVLGGLANVWMHNLTGGAWGEAIRAPLLDLGRTMWIAALLFLPVLAGMANLYPWAAHASEGTARWAGELSRPAFKSLWLMPWFFIARSVAYLAVWTSLAELSRRPALQRSKSFSAVALIGYGISVSLAAIDWIMSLMPLWYSSEFGLVAGIGQMLAGMAFAVVWIAFTGQRPAPSVFRDLGNLLMMYVMTWAYLAFVQFLIIWAENLPNEIAWYLPRVHSGWRIIGWLLILFQFFAPLLLLLFRPIKDRPAWLGALAAGLLAVHLLDVWWMILPSIPANPINWLWAAPLTAIVLGGAAFLALRRIAPHAPVMRTEETGHA
jgi:hypothetical protein